MTEHSADFDTDVLVVGTGPMGATTALALASYGVRVRAVNRRNWVADTPRAHVTNLRTMEVLRSLGVEREVVERSTPWQLMGDTMFTTSLTGREIARLRTYGTGDDRSGEYRRASPCTMADLPQPLLEPILVNAAAQRGAEFSFNTTFLSCQPDSSGVTVELEDGTSGRRYDVRSRYLVGADGANSRVAAAAELPVEGVMGRAGTVYAQFSGDLSRYMAHRPSILTWIVNQDAAVGEIGLGLLRAVHPWDRWIAGWGFDIATGDPDLSLETARARIKAYVGDPDFEPEITAINPWYVNQAYATAYANGRIFCGGDATHRHPPSNGLGSNTSIQDAYNLAWKLAYVIQGRAGDALLHSYTQERAPIGRQIVERANRSRHEFAALRQVLSTAAQATGEATVGLRAPTPQGAAARVELQTAVQLKDYEFNALGVEVNHRYRSDAVIPDGEPPAWTRDAELHAQPTTFPGAQLPHAWLVDRRGRRLSSLDLVGDGSFTLLTGLSGTEWVDAVRNLARPDVRAVVIGTDDAQDLYFEWQRIREIEEDGALLVRPDGVIAWRSQHSAGGRAREVLVETLATLLDVNGAAATAPAVAIHATAGDVR